MIYEYKNLKGVIKVGDTVRAVPGQHNPCYRLKDAGSNTAEITEVKNDHFYINGCAHSFGEFSYLEIVPTTPTWETLKVGDVIQHTDGDTAVVLAVIGDVFLKSAWRDHEAASSVWLTKKEARNIGYKLLTEPLEVTQAAVNEKFGREVKIVG